MSSSCLDAIVIPMKELSDGFEKLTKFETNAP